MLYSSLGYHINNNVATQYYNIFFVPKRCPTKEVRVDLNSTHAILATNGSSKAGNPITVNEILD